MIGILNGAFMFTSDLVKNIQHPDIYIDFMKVSSYGDEKESNREPRIIDDTKEPIQNTDVIVVEDIVDTGYSMAALLEMLYARKPNSIKVCSLLSKPSRREVDVPIDYLGFEVPDLFVLGYGLDDGGKHRNGRDIIYKVSN